MPLNADSSYSIYTKARPFRTAFLVDRQKTPPELLDAIYAFNLDQWGGRYNPIIPVVDGTISHPYFSLLRFTDPDMIYSYAELSESTVSSIARQVRPLIFLRHRESPLGDDRVNYNVMEHEGARLNVEYCIAQFSDPFKSSPASVLTCREEWKCSEFRFVQRNFGAYNDNMVGRALPPNVGAYLVEESTGLVSALAARSAGRGVIYPIHFSALDSGTPEVEKASQYDAYYIVFGDDVQSWLRAWNRIFYLPTWRRVPSNLLCLPPAFINDKHGMDLLKEFIRVSFHRFGNTSSQIVFESFQFSEKELSEGTQVLTKNADIIPRYSKIEGEEIPDIKYESHSPLNLRTWKHHHRQGEKVFVPIDLPDIVAQKIPDTSCMVDVLIEYRPERFAYTNMTYWWRLPRTGKLTDLFLTNRAGRITSNGFLSTKVSAGLAYKGLISADTGGQHIELHIPDDLSVFRSVYLSDDRPYYTSDVRKPTGRPYGRMAFSDKGKIIRGYLQLFSSLYSASHFCENRFWRNSIEWLCERGPGQEAPAEERIRNRIRKNLDALKTNLATDESSAMAWLTQLILREARRAPLITPEISFEKLLKRLTEERIQFQQSEHGHVDFPIDEAANKADLEQALFSLTRDSIFLQGIRPKCPSCGSTAWHACQEIAQVMECRGCRGKIPLPVEPNWVYRLNELIVNAVAYHGVLPVIWTLGHLLQESRESFLFFPSAALYEKWEDNKPVAEVDITCLIDGLLLIGEVKTSAEEFDEEEIRKIEVICRKIFPDMVVLSAFKGDMKHLERRAVELKEKLADLAIDVEAIKPSDDLVRPEYHISCETQIHKIF